MNQQDVFLIHMRELYASKLRNEPAWRESGNASPSELLSGMDSGSESVPFVVDWQMESVEYHLSGSNCTETTRTESYLNVSPFMHEQLDACEKEKYTHIFDW
jgi:hypothetical protein